MRAWLCLWVACVEIHERNKSVSVGMWMHGGHENHRIFVALLMNDVHLLRAPKTWQEYQVLLWGLHWLAETWDSSHKIYNLVFYEFIQVHPSRMFVRHVARLSLFPAVSSAQFLLPNSIWPVRYGTSVHQADCWVQDRLGATETWIDTQTPSWPACV